MALQAQGHLMASSEERYMIAILRSKFESDVTNLVGSSYIWVSHVGQREAPRISLQESHMIL